MQSEHRSTSMLREKFGIWTCSRIDHKEHIPVDQLTACSGWEQVPFMEGISL